MPKQKSNGELLESRLESIKQKRNETGDALSAQVRTFALGVLALVWIMLSGSEAEVTGKFSSYSNCLLWIASWAVIALLFDSLQLVTSWVASHLAYRSSEMRSDPADVGYGAESTAFVTLAYVFMWLKVFAIAGASIALLATIWRGLNS